MNEYKIFFGDRFFLISNSEEKCFRSVNGIGVRIADINKANELFDFFEKSEILELYICTESADSVFNTLVCNNRYIIAAGGIVSNKNKDILLINRLGYWDLPKGKVEKNESEEVAACREIEEECGICNVKATNKITDTYHVYRLNGERIIKKTCWYDVVYLGDAPLIPQQEEDITEAKWVPREDVNKYIPKMYASVKEVIKVQK